MTVLASRILMIRPSEFRANEQTAASNVFQNMNTVADSILSAQALQEFDGFQTQLRRAGVEVISFDAQAGGDTPDALFPNNWMSVLPNGQIYLFPMLAKNRRQERRQDIVKALGGLIAKSQSHGLFDLSYLENENCFLEGTGSLIFDHQNQTAYACLSQRTHVRAIQEFEKLSNYKVHTFAANVAPGKEIYHTNVMLSLGEHTAILCAEAISSFSERQELMDRLTASGRTLLLISIGQMLSFAGNMLQLRNHEGQRLWICSSKAYHSLAPEQVQLLTRDSLLVHSNLDSIENAGGGSARCLLAEVF